MNITVTMNLGLVKLLNLLGFTFECEAGAVKRVYRFGKRFHSKRLTLR